MSGISQYSYLLAYRMIPQEYTNENLTKEKFKELDAWKNFDDYGLTIFGDAIDSIARVWLHVWIRYRDWAFKKTK